eukprot:9875625-Ditylum_brightwellii.AAC.1
MGKKWILQDSPSLHIADLVSISFHLQKQEKEREETVMMHKIRDCQLNPVAHCAFTVKRVRKIISFSKEWLVDFIGQDGELDCISSTDIRFTICTTVQAYGKDKLGFKAEDMGTHSKRSGAAMTMYLAGVPVYTIMLIRRWS